MVPRGNETLCRNALGERHQRYQALNHMCNQSKLTARRQVRVTSRPGCLKARDVQRQLLGMKHSSSRDAGSMALRRSVSFPRGTMVTYVTWDVPLLEPRAVSERFRGTRCPRRQTCKSLLSVEEHSYGKRKEEPEVACKSLSRTWRMWGA